MLSALPMDNNLSEHNQTSIELKKLFQKSPSTLLKSIPQKKFLKKFYRQNEYTPLWLKSGVFDKEKYSILFKHIQNDPTLYQKGLIYKNYEILNKQLDTNLSAIEHFRVELKLTSLYYNFLQHIIYGEIEWKHFSQKLSSLKRKRINAAWIKAKPNFNIQNLMYQEDIETTLYEVTPKNFGYSNLLLALQQLEQLKKEGAWDKLPNFRKLELGDSGDIVLKLRHRLSISGDYIDCNESDELVHITDDHNESRDMNLSRDAVFGHCLDTAVKVFQERHGLVVDGIVGGGTQRALNTTIDEKIEKIRLNIDRIKWLPREDHERYLIVNIPEFMLYYLENNRIKKELRVIVGDKKHPTPIFSQNISYIVLNPYWKIPEGIVRREIVPAMIKNPNYLRQQGLEAHRTWDEKSRIIDTSWLYWPDYLYKQKFPYRLMQPPGPKNALGKIKFKFPNRFSVYLHDTPTKHLFKKTVRAYSHGCVRLSQPRSLLETIATFNPKIDIKKAKKVLKGKRKTYLHVNNKLRIYLVYLTAGMNEKGQIEFRNDIYNYDKYQKRRVR